MGHRFSWRQGFRGNGTDSYLLAGSGTKLLAAANVLPGSGRHSMTGKMQHSRWILSLRRRTLNAALALAVVLPPTVMATRPAQAQTFTQLYQFVGGSSGANPIAGLVPDAAGNLYGTTSA